uniref:Protein kinase domain-containing protein n=2 Tax=Paramoeba aestuarina TaxID=180227 RepID=A0A7S4NAL8_9EUKA|mmetsp:Transcript_13222/g.20391  ORF Transcript_13222/g.20391 Transcript_13222/m.20391 type:complete len:444 (+) Transcript_13222:400-1731(+)
MTLQEVRDLQIPALSYESGPLAGSSTQSEKFVNPEAVMAWPDFQGKMDSAKATLEKSLTPGLFVKKFEWRHSPVSQEDHIYPVFHHNVFGVMGLVYPTDWEGCFVMGYCIPCYKFKPDLYVRESPNKESKHLPIEIKGDLPLDLVAGWTAKDSLAVSAISQEYTYMIACKRKFGILSSYEKTFFLSVGEGGSLLVSPLIKREELIPCLMDFLSIASLWEVWENPPSLMVIYDIDPEGGGESGGSDESGDGNGDSDSSDFEMDDTEKERETSPAKRRSTSGNNPNNCLSLIVNESDCLGFGANGVVYRTTYKGRWVALKVVNTKDLRAFQEVLNEVRFYNQLKKVQGSLIARMFWSGWLSATQYGVILELYNPPGEVSEAEQQHLLHQLTLLGVKHGDFRKANFVRDDEGNLLLIDFGRSHFLTTSDASNQASKLHLQRLPHAQ